MRKALDLVKGWAGKPSHPPLTDASIGAYTVGVVMLVLGAFGVEEELPLALERLGFHGRVSDGRLELTGCPCSLVLPGRPELLCELAVAVVDGVLTGTGSGLKVGRRMHHPDERRCAVGLEAAA